MQLTKSTADANKPENSFLNRYRDVKPYDHTRVKLETHHDTDYINASLVRVTIISCKTWVEIFDITLNACIKIHVFEFAVIIFRFLEQIDNIY